jgi:hypothetical protein
MLVANGGYRQLVVNCGLLCAIDNITTTMIDPANERESLLALPLQERTVAVALKHIFDRINDLQEEETKATQNIHQSFIARFKDIEHQVRPLPRRPAGSSRAVPSRRNSSTTPTTSSPRRSARRRPCMPSGTRASLPTG